MRRNVTALLAIVALMFGLTACSSTPASTDQAGAVKVGGDTVVLDVRTPAEYAEGHLTGATLMDFNAGAVAAAIPTLDPAAEYLVYCRSGNRAGQAIELMKQAGITSVTNLGSLQQAADATGLSIER